MRILLISIVLLGALIGTTSIAQQRTIADDRKAAVEATLSFYDPSLRAAMRPNVEAVFSKLSQDQLKQIISAAEKSGATPGASTSRTDESGSSVSVVSPTTTLSGSSQAIEPYIRRLWNANIRFDEALNNAVNAVKSKMARQRYESYGAPAEMKIMFVVTNNKPTPSYEEFKKAVLPSIVVPAGGKFNPATIPSQFDQVALNKTVNDSYMQFRNLAIAFERALLRLYNQPELRRDKDAFRKAVLELTQSYQKQADSINTSLASEIDKLRPSVGSK